MTSLLLTSVGGFAAILVVYVWLKRDSNSRLTAGYRIADTMIRKLPHKPLLQLVPATNDCCESAYALQTHRFARSNPPTLPLAYCTMRESCRCRLLPVAERRSGKDRRSGIDRRSLIRYEVDKDPRRRNRGRRKEDQIWNLDGR